MGHILCSGDHLGIKSYPLVTDRLPRFKTWERDAWPRRPHKTDWLWLRKMCPLWVVSHLHELRNFGLHSSWGDSGPWTFIWGWYLELWHSDWRIDLRVSFLNCVTSSLELYLLMIWVMSWRSISKFYRERSDSSIKKISRTPHEWWCKKFSRSSPIWGSRFRSFSTISFSQARTGAR